MELTFYINYLDWYFVFNNISHFLTWYFTIWVFCPQWNTIAVQSGEICCAIFCAICPQCHATSPFFLWNIRRPVKCQLQYLIGSLFSLSCNNPKGDFVYKWALQFYVRIALGIPVTQMLKVCHICRPVIVWHFSFKLSVGGF